MGILHSTAETAEILGIGESAVTKARLSGQLDHRRVGRLVKFSNADIESYVELIKARNVPGSLRRTDTARRRKRT